MATLSNEPSGADFRHALRSATTPQLLRWSFERAQNDPRIATKAPIELSAIAHERPCVQALVSCASAAKNALEARPHIFVARDTRACARRGRATCGA